jgi:hypothetical protein
MLIRIRINNSASNTYALTITSLLELRNGINNPKIYTNTIKMLVMLVGFYELFYSMGEILFSVEATQSEAESKKKHRL